MDDYKIIYTEQLDKIINYLKLNKYATVIQIAELGSNHNEAILWLENNKLIKKEVVDGITRYSLTEIQKDEIPKKEVKTTNENGKEKESS